MSNGAARWADACHAAAIFAVDPAGTGVCLRARPGLVRDRWFALLRRLLPPETQMRRVPLGIADDRLLGGLDLVATLRAGRPVLGRGLLAEADGHVLVLVMAERLSAAMTGRLAAAQDRREVVVEREGFGARSPFHAGVVAVDEGIDPEEQPPPALLDRLAFWLDADGLPMRELVDMSVGAAEVQAARDRSPQVTVGDATIAALCSTAAALGIGSPRAPMLALRVARAAAALAGRDMGLEEDAVLAARLVLAARARAVPQPEPSEPEQQQDDAAGSPALQPPDAPQRSEASQPTQADLVLAAALAALPAGLLAQLQTHAPTRSKAAPGRAGPSAKSPLRGRPLGATPGELGAGARLALIDTIRAAAPWQKLRQASPGRIAVQPSDIRVVRFRSRSRSTTLFAVDASGSSARNRLAEAKGAVELLLADSYVRRDQVAVIAFRGKAAELLLPPTSSLVRAKRSLAGLPGGGGTPLASGLDAACALAQALRRRGETPILVLLTDGSANIARDGTPGRLRAAADALDAARAFHATGCNAVLVDIAPRPQAQARDIAQALAARYVPLPYADAQSLARVLTPACQAQR